MGLPEFCGVTSLVITWLLLLLHIVNTQDANYYFTTSHSQNRFVPSPPFGSARHPLQQTYLTGSRTGIVQQQPAQQQPAAAFQDQLLYLGNEGNIIEKEQHQLQQQPLTSSASTSTGTSAYSPFGSQYNTQIRNTDYYDISPRPFGVATAASTNSFTRSKPFRPSSAGTSSGSSGGGSTISSNGFVPQQLQQIRANVPHQQTQFLAHFNEPNVPNVNRPFGNGGFTPSSARNRPVPASNYNADSQAAAQTTQQLPFRNTRNRFQPSSATSSAASPLTATSTEATLPTSSKRYNRFGNGRAQLPGGFRPLAAQSNSVLEQRPSFGRTTNKSVASGFKPKRPIYGSREVNAPVNAFKPQRPYGLNAGRIPPITSSAKPDENYSEEYEEEDEENPPHDNVADADKAASEEVSLEKLELHEAGPNGGKQEGINATVPTTSSTEEITKSPQSEDEFHAEAEHEYENSEVYSDEQTEYHNAETTTTHSTTDYEYEYDDDESTEVPSDSTTTTTTSSEGLRTTSISESGEPYLTTVLPQTSESAFTTLSTEVTTPVSTKDLTTIPDKAEDVGVTDDEALHTNLPKDNRYSATTTAATAKTAKDSEPLNDSFDREVVSVVTTKSVINGSTAFLPAVTPKTTTLSIEEEEEAIFNENKVPPASTDDEGDEGEEGEDDDDDDDDDGDDGNDEKMIKQSAGNETDQSVNNATESYVVIASIQTSRSLNGARFLPFPAIEQEETKQTLSELERKIHGQQKAQKTQSKNKIKDDDNTDQSDENDEVGVTTARITASATTTSSASSSLSSSSSPSSSSTESIIDKLDRVQSELSSGLLSGKYPIISQMDISTQSTTVTKSGGKFAPNIRKFQPKSTVAPASSQAKSTHRHSNDDNAGGGDMDDLTGLLPVGFKPRTSYKNRKITTTTSRTELNEFKKPARNATIGRSFKNSASIVQDVELAGLLPKGYKFRNSPTTTTTTSTTTAAPTSAASSTEESSPQTDIKDIFSKIKFDENLDKLLPKDYKLNGTTAKPPVTLVDDISAFLPPGYKLPSSTSTTKKPSTIPLIQDDISKFLPPGYKPPADSDTGGIIPLKADDISKFLPPGYKLDKTNEKNSTLPETVDISHLLPKGYNKALESKDQQSEPDDVFKKIEFKEIASLLPTGYKANASSVKQHPASTTTSATPSASTTEKTGDTATTAASGSGFKVVFPKGIHKRLGAQRLTTPRTNDGGDSGAGGDGSAPQVLIKKGPPIRVTTEFTGWPTPSTTPLSIERLLEQSRTASINFEDLLSSTSSTSTTTTTTSTTTTTTTPKPTRPGHCTSDCDLAATIKIIDGVQWKPELLDHNTVEWKNLAHEIEAQLNEVYMKAPQLSNWYKKVRIDSFSQGSVLVDYYVELANITQDVNTLEIKRLFHDALTHPSLTRNDTENEMDTESDDSMEKVKEEKLVKETFLMGKYVIDPTATDFSVIPKAVIPVVEYAEDDLLIPQWAIVVIVIGVGSLVFVVIFGVTVLLNRQKRSKKTPVALTNDMLNELKINHMGGVDNYGVDDFYNIDDAWNDTKQPIKPKRFTNSVHGSSASNIYDSWRSTRHGDYVYDPQTNYSQKGDSLQRSHHQPQQHHNHHHHQQQPYNQQQSYGHQYPDAFADAHQMYTYNNHNASSRTRYPRDYDPEF